jgi:hypothetical protein
MQLNATSFEAQNWEYIQNSKYFWTLLYIEQEMYYADGEMYETILMQKNE